jgi:sec-independent protein translocase protein TatB
MFDIGFSEILVIFVLALVVLGPEKLPRVVREVGRWVGRARAMARQFQEQLEEEVDSSDRNRTLRPEPVRPVGGAPAGSPSSVTMPSSEATSFSEATRSSEATSSAMAPEHTEPVSNGAAPWHTAADPLPEAAASSGNPPPEPLTPGTHESGT